MKQISILIILVCTLSSLVGQDRYDKIEEKIEVRRTAYLTQVLDLGVSEAQAFWPLYNAYKKEQLSLKEQFKSRKSNKDKSAEEKLDAMMTYDAEVFGLKNKYTEQFRELLGAEKTIKLIRAQREFKEKLLKRVKETRKHR